MLNILVFNTNKIDFISASYAQQEDTNFLHFKKTSSFYHSAIGATDRREQQLQCVDIHLTHLSPRCKNRLYSQAYVMEKLFPILTISTWGTSLGISWWCESANRNTSYSCDSGGNNPPVGEEKSHNTLKQHRQVSGNTNEMTKSLIMTRLHFFLFITHHSKPHPSLLSFTHLCWYYLGNWNRSTIPENWCRAVWGFAAYFLLH